MHSSATRRALMIAALLATGAVAGCAKTSVADGGGLDPSARYGAASGPGSVGEFTSSVGDRVFFETDSTELTETGQATLDKQATWLNRYPRYAFTVEGHADERGTREYNFALGARRSETVKNYLAAKGVAASRVKTTSFGKERPVATCDDISCWSQNRRTVTVLAGAAGS